MADLTWLEYADQAAGDPVLDADDYPSDLELDRIADWPTPTELPEYKVLMNYVKARWGYDEWEEAEITEWSRPYHQYTFSTLGWSGNESLVSAMERNTMLQMIAAYSWQRGGHYVYRLPLS